MSGLSAAHATDRLRRDLDARLNELQQYEKLADVQTMIKSDLKVAEDEYARAPPTLSPSIGAAMPRPRRTPGNRRGLHRVPNRSGQLDHRLARSAA